MKFGKWWRIRSNTRRFGAARGQRGNLGIIPQGIFIWHTMVFWRPGFFSALLPVFHADCQSLPLFFAISF